MRAAQVSQHPRVAGGGCLSSHHARTALIYDHPDLGRCFIRQRGEEISPYDFTVQNSSGRTFHLLAVDKCMFTDETDGTRCDCVVFTEAVSLFVEFKSSRSTAGRQKVRKKAISQICASIEWFLSERLLDDLEAVEVIVANGTCKRHPSFNDNIIDKTTELQKLFPNLRIRYGELPFRKL
jgi:hypothetical protein